MGKKTNKDFNFCVYQTIDDDGEVVCMASMAEGRLLICPYDNSTQAKEDEYHCLDYIST